MKRERNGYEEEEEEEKYTLEINVSKENWKRNETAEFEKACSVCPMAIAWPVGQIKKLPFHFILIIGWKNVILMKDRLCRNCPTYMYIIWFYSRKTIEQLIKSFRFRSKFYRSKFQHCKIHSISNRCTQWHVVQQKIASFVLITNITSIILIENRIETHMIVMQQCNAKRVSDTWIKLFALTYEKLIENEHIVYDTNEWIGINSKLVPIDNDDNDDHNDGGGVCACACAIASLTVSHEKRWGLKQVARPVPTWNNFKNYQWHLQWAFVLEFGISCVHVQKFMTHKTSSNYWTQKEFDRRVCLF